MGAKIFNTGAFRNNKGNDPQLASGGGWGDRDTQQDLTDGERIIPYFTLGAKLTSNKEKDNSIVGSAFETQDRKLGQMLENPYSMPDRFSNLNPVLYWMFGCENDVKRVMVFKGVADPWGTSEPAPGTEFEDVTAGTTQKFTYLRNEIVRFQNGTFSLTFIYSQL